MDPNACYLLLLSALERGDDYEANEAAVDLREWMRKGGFAPTNGTADEVANAIQRGMYAGAWSKE